MALSPNPPRTNINSYMQNVGPGVPPRAHYLGIFRSFVSIEDSSKTPTGMYI